MANDFYECIGIGCGPSNLSVASQLYGLSDTRNIFFEKKTEFSWHNGMMLPDASLQVSMFKDLVTLAEPTNPFSFVYPISINAAAFCPSLTRGSNKSPASNLPTI